MNDRVGQQFGNYRLTQLIGQGGFADVYLGEHIYLKTQAALKVLRIHLSEDALAEFLNEARTIAHLEHPHIVRILEYGVEGQTPFLVMSYAPNGTLRRRHPKGHRLQVEEVLQYVQQIASALDYAHEQKLIHRDIKPENMLLGHHNEVLLSDFGLVLIAQSTGSQTMKEMAGTVPYMAPEQLQGKARPASDQYALGIIVYEWLSGEQPFQGSFAEIASQHLLTPPPPLHGRIPGISPEVERVVFTALAKEPQQRFPNVQAFATALAQACNRVQDSSLATPLTSLPPRDTTHSTILMSPSVQPIAHVNTPPNWSSPSTPIITPSNHSQPSADVPSLQNQSPQPPPIIPSQPINMNTLLPYEQVASKKKRNNLSRGKVALLVGLVLLVLGGTIASFIVKWMPITAATSTPTPSRGAVTSTTASLGRTTTAITAPRTSDMSLVPHSMQLLGFTGWDYGSTKVILPPMRQIPAGPFKMGSDPNQDPDAKDEDFKSQQPIQQFSLTLGAYQIGTYDVTVAEYQLAVDNKAVPPPSSQAAVPGGPILTWASQQQNPDYPVVNISWWNAAAYVSWLAKCTGVQWRLPTEAEWEKAARGTDGRIYSYGNTYMQGWANTDKMNPGPTSVGSYLQDKSPYGVFDMSGNVTQWTSTIFKPTTYTPNDGRENLKDTTSLRVRRGGEWDTYHGYGRAAYRGYGDPSSYHPSVGFRLAY